MNRIPQLGWTSPLTRLERIDPPDPDPRGTRWPDDGKNPKQPWEMGKGTPARITPEHGSLQAKKLLDPLVAQLGQESEPGE